MKKHILIQRFVTFLCASLTLTAGSLVGFSQEKTSFQEVASHLDTGGNFYLYLGTEPCLKNLSGKLAEWRGIVNAIPNLGEEARRYVPKVFDLASSLIRKSGIEEISGLGISSIEREAKRYHTKVLLHHYRGQGSGFLWSMFGKQPHALGGLDFLPGTTALAGFTDVDLPMFWSLLREELSKCGIPEVEKLMSQVPSKFEEATGMSLDRLLASFGGEFGLIVTLDDSKKITLPLPLPQPVEIPEFGVAIVAKVQNDTLFNRLDELLKQNPQVVSREQEGVKSRTLPLPLPLPLPIRPTVASGQGYFFLCSSDTILDEILAAKSGKKPGLRSSEEFKALARGVPTQGNSFNFMSAKFGQAVMNVQKTALQAAAQGHQGLEVLEKLFTQTEAPISYAVSSNTDQGWLTVGNGNQHAAKSLLAPLVVVPGVMAAIAIPNFVRARETAQRNAIINNLRQLDGAKEQWALENKKKDGDTPAESDVTPYLKGNRMPSPIRGESYQINAVGQKPFARLPNGSTINLP